MQEQYNTSLSETQTELDSRFSPKKRNSEFVSMLFHNLDFDNRANKIFNCGSFLEFRVSPVEHKLFNANFCKDRFCSMCQWRRSLKIFSQVSQVMDYLERDNFRYLFLTLTIKNCSAAELSNTLDILTRGFYNLYRSKEFKRSVVGSFRNLEITFNRKSNQFHPHLHCILAVRPSYFNGDNYLKSSKWSEIWSKCISVDYNPVVYVETVKSGFFDGKMRSVKSAVAEVSKYAIKDSDILYLDDLDLSEHVLSVLIDSLHGRRLCSFTGCFSAARSHLNLDDIEKGDLIHLDDSLRPDIEFLLVRYHWKSGLYVRDPVRCAR